MSKTQRLRDQLYMLQGSKCFYCDRPIQPHERTLEHLVPDSSGGQADLDNGAVICESANQLLGCTTPKQKMLMLKAGGGKIECPRVARQQLDATLQKQAALRKEAQAALANETPPAVPVKTPPKSNRRKPRNRKPSNNPNGQAHMNTSKHIKK